MIQTLPGFNKILLNTKGYVHQKHPSRFFFTLKFFTIIVFSVELTKDSWLFFIRLSTLSRA